METLGMGPALDVLAVGVPALVVSVVVGSMLGRLGGAWAVAARSMGTAVAACTWLVFVNFHVPIGVAALLVALYPLLACEPGKALARRAALLAAGVALSVDAAVGLVRWRYGLPEAVWVAMSLLMLIAPALVGLITWRVARRGYAEVTGGVAQQGVAPDGRRAGKDARAARR